MPSFVGLIHSNIKAFEKSIEQAQINVEKAGMAAVRVEAFQLAKKLKAEIRSGDPGGRQFKPLSILRTAWQRRTKRDFSPLSRLAIPVRYWVDYTGGQYNALIGYQDKPIVSASGSVKLRPSQGKVPQLLSKSWLYLARAHQEGFNEQISDFQRRHLRRIGGEIKKKGDNRMAAPFFLLRGRQRFFTPARPIVDPFWRANQGSSPARIRANFDAKLRGENIFAKDYRPGGLAAGGSFFEADDVDYFGRQL